jgi:hypothetical protein
MKYNLETIIEKHLSLDKKLSSDELEDCLQDIANSLLPLKDILQNIPENFLILREEWSQKELRHHLQKTANVFLPLLDNMSPVLILIEENKLFNDEKREAVACYYPEKEVEAGNKQEKESNKQPTDFIKVSERYLASCRYSPGKWLGLLLHELIHAYVARTFRDSCKFKARFNWSNGHNVWFFTVALAFQAQLELILSKWTSLQARYGFIDLHLQTTIDNYTVLRRRYDPHLERARSQLMLKIEKALSFLLAAREETKPLEQDSSSLYVLTFEEGYEGEYSIGCGDVIYCPQLFCD